MDEQKIIFEVENLIEESFLLMENYDDKKAKRIVKQVFYIDKLVNKLLEEAKTAAIISNIAENEQTKAVYERYIGNLRVINQMFSNYVKYQPKTKKGYYMFIKDITTYANEFVIIK